VQKIGMTSAISFFLLLGMTASIDARQEKPEKQEEKAKPARQEPEAKPERKQEAKNPQREQPAKTEKQPDANRQRVKSTKQQEHQQAKEQPEQKQSVRQSKAASEQQAQVNRLPRQQQRPEQQQGKPAPREQQQAEGRQDSQWQDRAARPPQRTQEAENRQRAQPRLRLSARGDKRISNTRFRSSFGREHRFQVGNPVLVGGYSRFRYGGYWFGFVEPWPTDWYFTDDVYIDYVDGGYYMYNSYYPDTRFALTVVI
jgi:hypothetical protein